MKDANKRKYLLPLDIQMFAEGAEHMPIDDPNPEDKPEVKTVTMTQEELDALIVREKGRFGERPLVVNIVAYSIIT